MNEESKRSLKIFLTYSALIALLASFNLYAYFASGKALSLAVGSLCIVALIGWVCFYLFYICRRER
jgi:hypothetical protein